MRVAALFGFLAVASAAHSAATSIWVAPNSSPLEKLAAAELQRYLYLRTGELPSISNTTSRKATFVVRLADAAAKPIGTPGAFRLEHADGVQNLVGDDPLGALYAAYRYAELLGVRFGLDGDIVPDDDLVRELPQATETRAPLFTVRGIQPFHDFPEGPDSWTREDYLAIIAQLPKLGMNFIGFHAYPEGGAGPEPLVWMGLVEDLEPSGAVRRSYPSWWANTARDGAWGYQAKKTSDFHAGASRLFAEDVWGSPVQKPYFPKPTTTEAENEVFDRAGALMGEAFSLARNLGVLTCVGPETPMTVPAKLRAHLQELGLDPDSLSVRKRLYEGMIERLRRTSPADYFWLWTPENWTWSGNSEGDFRATLDDLLTAYEAVQKVGAGMKFATSGWVLGPEGDRAALDRLLPKGVALSAINRNVGHAEVDRAFGEVRRAEKWAIPWLENDPSLTAPQLWMGRMRKDAIDARGLGCDGLIGIHWRTRVLTPTIAALAGAAWDQSFAPPYAEKLDRAPDVFHVGGQTASFPQTILDADPLEVYQTCRFGMSAFRLPLPKGSYKLRLMFCEPHHDKPGERVFSVSVQGKPVVTDLDLIAKVGKNRAYDLILPSIEVSDGTLVIEFSAKAGYPVIQGILAEGKSRTLGVNCGGPYVDGFAEDVGSDLGDPDRAAPIHDLALGFCRASFGAAAAEKTAEVFERIDGTKLPSPTTWIDGPGGIVADPEPWPQAALRYEFVDDWLAIRQSVVGAANLARFDGWGTVFEYLRALGRASCARGKLDLIVGGGPVNGPKAADARRELEEAMQQVLELAVRQASNVGELGTICNLEQHVLGTQRFLTRHDEALGVDSTDGISREYEGEPRLVVPTARTLARPGARLEVPVWILGGEFEGSLRWRVVGSDGWSEELVRHISRGIYETQIPVLPQSGLVEYYIAGKVGNTNLSFPAGAPKNTQTIVLSELCPV